MVKSNGSEWEMVNGGTVNNRQLASHDAAISVNNLSKTYKLYPSPKERVKELLHPFGKKYHNDFPALRGVSFDVKKGESIGIIGCNGSGKSTLLQIICGIMQPTEGEVKVNGRVSALLELGAGFNPDFTGRENVYMNGAIMGFAEEEMDERFKAIAEFAEIGDFIDQPVRIYSSGMYLRLGFACAVNVDSEILIIDEAMAVGDARFRRKCYAKIGEFCKSGKTVLLVTHSMGDINQLCNRTLLLDKGRVADIGEPRKVTKLFNKMLFGVEKGEVAQKPTSAQDLGKSAGIRHGDQKAEIIDFGILDKSGKRVTQLETGEKYTIFSKILFNEDLDGIHLGFPIRNVKGVPLFSTNTYRQNVDVPPQKRGNILEGRLQVTMWLAPGDYFLTFNVWKDGPVMHDMREDALHFKVTGDIRARKNSLVNLEPEMSVENIE